ncbi:hypothetical protein E3A20_18290, partial [Planctomyces bekefii]
FMNGGEVRDAGYNWSQGKQEPRVGEWTKLMIKGRGFFVVGTQTKISYSIRVINI